MARYVVCEKWAESELTLPFHVRQPNDQFLPYLFILIKNLVFK